VTTNQSAKLQELRDAVVIGVNQFAPKTITLIGDLHYGNNHYRLTRDVSVTELVSAQEVIVPALREQMRTELAEHALKEAG